MKKTRKDLLDIPTEQEEMGDEAGKGHVEWGDYIFRVIARWSSLLVFFAVLILLAFAFWGDKRAAIICMKYLFVVTGGVQICAGVYLGISKQKYLVSVVEQERRSKTIFVRRVDQYRLVLRVLRDVQNTVVKVGGLNAVAIHSLQNRYAKFVRRTSSGRRSIGVISQKDLASMFMESSKSAFSGTIFLIIGTLIMAFSEIFPSMVA
ncbi:hypothetical protein VDP41_12785 [Xanthomonas campestris pv. campestris]|nr:hypothetical protein [Xanthomonas campestris pv. campestris]MEB1940285.1 hypothetical protein [Xanthomonas campestris pv. campestris]